MEKLVITYCDGDEFEPQDFLYCVEYESAEAFYYELDEKLKCLFEKYKAKTNYFETRFIFCGIEFDGRHFFHRIEKRFRDKNGKAQVKIELIYKPPQVRTLDEWFAERLSENTQMKVDPIF